MPASKWHTCGAVMSVAASAALLLAALLPRWVEVDCAAAGFGAANGTAAITLSACAAGPTLHLGLWQACTTPLAPAGPACADVAAGLHDVGGSSAQLLAARVLLLVAIAVSLLPAGVHIALACAKRRGRRAMLEKQIKLRMRAVVVGITAVVLACCAATAVLMGRIAAAVAALGPSFWLMLAAAIAALGSAVLADRKMARTWARELAVFVGGLAAGRIAGTPLSAMARGGGGAGSRGGGGLGIEMEAMMARHAPEGSHAATIHTPTAGGSTVDAAFLAALSHARGRNASGEGRDTRAG